MPVKGMKDEPVEVKDTLKLPEEFVIALKMGDAVYIAQESDGYVTPLPGCFIKTNNGFIISELTIVKGMKATKDVKGIVTEVPATFPIIFYNKNGERSHCSTEDNINFNGNSISFKKVKVRFEEIPHTLMSLDTGKRFLKGEVKEIKDIYPILKAKQSRFISFQWDTRLYDLLTCNTIGTYFFDVFGVFPITWFFGVTDTGKSRGLMCLVYAARKGIYWEDVTNPTVKRMADFLQPTLGIDEYQDVEHILRGHVRSCYKEGVSSPRLEESRDGWVLRAFAIFHPTVIASTEEIDYASFTRTIPIKMMKGNPIEDRDPTEYDFDDNRDDLYICRLTQANKVYETFQTLRKAGLGLLGREWEIWRAPLTIAKMVSEEVFNNVLNLAREICSSKKEELYVEEKDVLIAIYSLFDTPLKPKTIFFFPKEITEKIWTEKKEEFTANEWKDDDEFKKKYSPQNLSYVLRRMKIESKYVTKGTRYKMTSGEYNTLAVNFGIMKSED